MLNLLLSNYASALTNNNLKSVLVLSCAVLCCAELYCAVLCCAVQSNSCIFSYSNQYTSLDFKFLFAGTERNLKAVCSKTCNKANEQKASVLFILLFFVQRGRSVAYFFDRKKLKTSYFLL